MKFNMFRKAEESRKGVDKYTYIHTHTNKILEGRGRKICITAKEPC